MRKGGCTGSKAVCLQNNLDFVGFAPWAELSFVCCSDAVVRQAVTFVRLNSSLGWMSLENRE